MSFDNMQNSVYLGAKMRIGIFFLFLFFLFLSFSDIYYLYIGVISTLFLFVALSSIRQTNTLNFSVLFYTMGMLYAIGPLLSALSGNLSRSVVDNHIGLILYVIIAMLSFLIGYHATNKPKFHKKKHLSVNPNSFSLLLILDVLMFIYVASKLYIISRIGLYAFIENGRGMTKMEIGESFGFLNIFDTVVYLVEVMSLEFYLLTRKTKNHNRVHYLLLFISSVVFSVGFSLLQVDRSQLLLSLLPLVFILNYHGLLSLRTIALSGVALFVLFVVWKQLIAGLIMGTIHSLNDLQAETPDELVAWFHVGCDVTDGLENGNIDYLYGYSYLMALESFFNPLWQHYEALSTWYVRVFRPDMFEHGGGKGFSCVVEAVLNFGFLGPTIVFGFLGSMIKRIESHISTSILYRCFYALLISLIYKFFRSEMYSVAKLSFWTWAVPLFFIWWTSKKRRRMNYVHK